MDRHWLKILRCWCSYPTGENFCNKFTLHYKAIQNWQHCQLCVTRKNSIAIAIFCCVIVRCIFTGLSHLRMATVHLWKKLSLQSFRSLITWPYHSLPYLADVKNCKYQSSWKVEKELITRFQESSTYEDVVKMIPLCIDIDLYFLIHIGILSKRINKPFEILTLESKKENQVKSSRLVWLNM